MIFLLSLLTVKLMGILFYIKLFPPEHLQAKELFHSNTKQHIWTTISKFRISRDSDRMVLGNSFDLPSWCPLWYLLPRNLDHHF